MDQRLPFGARRAYVLDGGGLPDGVGDAERRRLRRCRATYLMHTWSIEYALRDVDGAPNDGIPDEEVPVGIEGVNGTRQFVQTLRSGDQELTCRPSQHKRYILRDGTLIAVKHRGPYRLFLPVFDELTGLRPRLHAYEHYVESMHRYGLIRDGRVATNPDVMRTERRLDEAEREMLGR